MGERLPSPFYHKLLLEDEGVALYYKTNVDLLWENEKTTINSSWKMRDKFFQTYNSKCNYSAPL